MSKAAVVGDSGRPRRKTYLVAGTLIVLFLVGIINWCEPALRFQNHFANEATLVGFLLLPLPAAWLFAKEMRGRVRIFVLVLLAPLIAFSSCTAFVIGFFGLPMIAGEPDDASFRAIEHLEIGPSAVILYRTDCGATCAVGLEARQEREIIPGVLKIVRVLGRWYPAYEGSIAPAGANRVRIAVAASQGGGTSPTTGVWILRPWVFF